MTDEQKTQALALAQIPDIGREIQDAHPIGTRIAAPAPSWIAWVPDLADETGAVEGVLHRVLERLVGELVELTDHSKHTAHPPAWVAWSRSLSLLTPSPPFGRPDRLTAIVDALLALPQGAGR